MLARNMLLRVSCLTQRKQLGVGDGCGWVCTHGHSTPGTHVEVRGQMVENQFWGTKLGFSGLAASALPYWAI